MIAAGDHVAATLQPLRQVRRADGRCRGRRSRPHGFPKERWPLLASPDPLAGCLDLIVPGLNQKAGVRTSLRTRPRGEQDLGTSGYCRRSFDEKMERRVTETVER
jgi:hypothetical protein